MPRLKFTRGSVFGLVALLMGGFSAWADWVDGPYTCRCPDGVRVEATYNDTTNVLTVTVYNADGTVDTTTGGQRQCGDDGGYMSGTAASGAQWRVDVDDDAWPRDNDWECYCIGKNDIRPASFFVLPKLPFFPFIVTGGLSEQYTFTVRAAEDYVLDVATAFGEAEYSIRNRDSSVLYGSYVPIDVELGDPAEVQGEPGFYDVDVTLTFGQIEGVVQGQRLSASTTVEVQVVTDADNGLGLTFSGDVTNDDE